MMNDEKHPQKNSRTALVYVVNDSTTQLAYLSNLLKKEGLEVQIFIGPEAALASMKSGTPPDLVVTDLHMPGIDGWRFCRLLRSPEYEMFNATPILVVSATFSGEDPEQITADLGANAFLPSPVDSGLFLEHVRRLLAGETPQMLTNALIIDNSKSVVALLSKTFEMHGYCVHKAYDGGDGMQLFRKMNPEIVVLDYHLPDTEDGRLINEFHTINPNCAVIVITSDPKPELALHVMKLGARAYARKPFDPKYLVTLCENARRELALLRAEALLEERTIKLRESEESYRGILDSMEEAYYEVDLKGNFTFFNSTAVRNLGYTNEEMMGMNFQRFVSTEESRKVFEAYNRVFLTGEPIRSFDWTIINKNGEKMAVEASISLRVDIRGNAVGFKGVVRDVSKRKKAEEALRKSEEKYRTILESIEDAYFELDLKGNFTFFNDFLSRFFGYSREELMGMNYKAYTAPVTAEKALQIYNEIYLTGRPKNQISYEIIRKDGSMIMVEMSIALLNDESGRPIGFRGIGREITERIRAEQKLKESEHRYRMITDNVHDTIWIIDFGLRLTYVSPSVLRLTGYSPEELVDTHLSKLLVPDSYARAEQTISEELAKKLRGKKQDQEEPKTMEIEMARKDGRDIWVEFTASFRYDEKGNPEDILVVSRDVTERRKAEERLRKSEERYKDILESIQEAYAEVDLQGNFIFFNESLCRMSGLSRKEILGMNYRALAAPEIADLIYEFFHEIYKTGRPSTLMDYEVIRKDGSKRVFELSASLMHDESGKPSGFRGLARDITDRKQAEEKLRELSLIDDLTGLNNRRGFTMLAAQQLKNADRFSQRVILIYADLDKMKWINDSLGHKEGDQALIDTANILRSSFRASDIIARMGGDEFVGLAVETGETTAEIILSRLREHLNAHNLHEKRHYKLSISYGVARYEPETPCSLDELLERGDKMMYEQKQFKRKNE